MSDSNRAQACDLGLGPGSDFKIGPFKTLCRYVDRGQQGEIERIRPPPTKSKNRLKTFFAVGYANFTPNDFAVGKRI